MDQQYSDGPDEWDEFQWERFLQEQDRTTEKYFGLVEKYLDHPDRDALVAREMGWNLFSELEEDAIAAMEEAFGEEGEEVGESSVVSLDAPVFADVSELCRWIDRIFDKKPHLQEDKHALELAGKTAVCSAKLAAALSQDGDEDVEPGMTIAYLKRGLKAANDALDAATRLAASSRITRRELGAFQSCLFRVRDQIVDLMRESRSQWNRRRGPQS